MNDIGSLQAILDQLYQSMLPLCAPIISVSRALAGLIALLTISLRVWGHISRAEAVDVFPLLRPFAIGLALLLYPALLGMMNGVLSPLVTATGNMVQGRQQAVQLLLQRSQTPDSLADEIDATFDYRTVVISLLEWLFEGAVLIISTIRTFILTVLSILGPLALGVSVLDGFRQSFLHWFARYVSVSLWLPVANIYGAIIAQVQLLMLQQDTSGNFTHGQGATYIIFLLMGIAGYACVPSTAGYVVHSLGGHGLLSRINRLSNTY